MVTFSNITTTSVTANWGSVVGALSYYLTVSPDSGLDVTGTYPGITDLFKDLTGFTTGTDYWIQVVGVDGGGDMESTRSAWTKFTTL